MLRVVDLNHWKGAINLAALPIDAMITKATGGNGYVDDTCDANVQQAIGLNLPWGVFHYFGDGFNDNDPISEANWFISNCQGYLGKGQIWLDWERGGNPNVNNVGMALAWLEHVRTTTGFKPAGIYMSNSLVLSLDWSPVINAGYALWDAAYVDNTTPIPNFQMDANRDPNPHWDGTVNDVMWQFTSTGQLTGYSGNLDCSFFYGDRNAWHAYINIPAAPAPAPAPAPQPAPAPSTTSTETPSESTTPSQPASPSPATGSVPATTGTPPAAQTPSDTTSVPTPPLPHLVNNVPTVTPTPAPGTVQTTEPVVLPAPSAPKTVVRTPIKRQGILARLWEDFEDLFRKDKSNG